MILLVTAFGGDTHTSTSLSTSLTKLRKAPQDDGSYLLSVPFIIFPSCNVGKEDHWWYCVCSGQWSMRWWFCDCFMGWCSYVRIRIWYRLYNWGYQRSMLPRRCGSPLPRVCGLCFLDLFTICIYSLDQLMLITKSFCQPGDCDWFVRVLSLIWGLAFCLCMVFPGLSC